MPVRPIRPLYAHALLHWTVFVWGFTAIFGKAITLGALSLVTYRMVISAVALAAWMRLRRRSFSIDRATAWKLWGTGVLVALHWAFFYACIKAAGIATAVVTLSTISFFTAIFEPVVFRRGIRWRDLALGVLLVVGVGILVRAEVGGRWAGLAMGLASALFSAAFGVINGKLSQTVPGFTITLHEFAAGAVVMSALSLIQGALVSPAAISLHDGALLLALAIGCTVLPWSWALTAVRTLGPYTVAVAVNLEPVYSMLMAFLLFPASERLSFRFYIGSAILIVLIAWNTWAKRGVAIARS